MQNLTIVEIIPKNRIELPAEFVSTKDKRESTTLYGYQKEAMIVITCYIATKGGLDTTDQMVRWFTSKRKTLRWPMVIFYNMLNISALNAFILWISLNKKNMLGNVATD